MEEKESMKFTEWVDSLTISDASNIIMIIIFTIVIAWLVVRTFRGKASA